MPQAAVVRVDPQNDRRADDQRRARRGMKTATVGPMQFPPPLFHFLLAQPHREFAVAGALEQAMNQIIDMASRINSLQEKMPKDFSQVEVEFGINFNWEVGAVLAKAGAQANINVTLTWTKPES